MLQNVCTAGVRRRWFVQRTKIGQFYVAESHRSKFKKNNN
jgi:hypothetical protein